MSSVLQRLALHGLLLACLSPQAVQAFEPVSGYEFLSEETRAMQDDDFENPGMMAVDRGEYLFREHRTDEEFACLECHGPELEALDLDRVASYPLYDENLGGIVTLQDQMHFCWEMNMDRFPLDYDAPEMVDLEAFVRYQARGRLINVRTDGELAPLLERGEALYGTRYGQMDMSCRHCHVQHQGQMLRGQRLSQGQANGFPEYRLGKGRITSLQQRMRECFISFRAEPFEPGSEEFRLLELFIMSRGNGLKIEAPAVRF